MCFYHWQKPFQHHYFINVALFSHVNKSKYNLCPFHFQLNKIYYVNIHLLSLHYHHFHPFPISIVWKCLFTGKWILHILSLCLIVLGTCSLLMLLQHSTGSCALSYDEQKTMTWLGRQAVSEEAVAKCLLCRLHQKRVSFMYCSTQFLPLFYFHQSCFHWYKNSCILQNHFIVTVFSLFITYLQKYQRCTKIWCIIFHQVTTVAWKNNYHKNNKQMFRK